MTTATINLNTVELTDDEAFAAYEREFHFSLDHDFDDLPEDLDPWEPSVEEYDREMTLKERERDFIEEQHEARIAYTSDPSTWGGDEFPF
jgi:hypothetical protein